MSKLNSDVVVTGNLTLQIIEDGKVTKTVHHKNLVTTLGKAHIANTLSAVALEDPMSQMAIGSGSGQTAASTTLASELTRSPLSKSQGVGGAANTVIYTSTIAEGDGTGAVTEAGIFNAGSGGTMLCYTDFTAIDKTSSVALLMEWTITIN